MAERRCIGCGKPAPRRLSQNGWGVTNICAKGLGSRWYRCCGCLTFREAFDLADSLFGDGRDYPERFPKEEKPDGQ
jgi:hypothetical protein